MVVGGPNQRSDYHFQPTEEFFYQVKGDMLLKIIEGGTFKDIPIKEGEMFMLPANTPHSPIRFESTVGLVVERSRPEGHDGMFFLPSASPPAAAGWCMLLLLREDPNLCTCKDELRWYCPNTKAHPQPTLIRKASFFCTDLGSQLKPHITQWNEDASLRVCAGCGYHAGARELIPAQETVHGKQP